MNKMGLGDIITQFKITVLGRSDMAKDLALNKVRGDASYDNINSAISLEIPILHITPNVITYLSGKILEFNIKQIGYEMDESDNYWRVPNINGRPYYPENTDSSTLMEKAREEDIKKNWYQEQLDFLKENGLEVYLEEFQ